MTTTARPLQLHSRAEILRRRDLARTQAGLHARSGRVWRATAHQRTADRLTVLLHTGTDPAGTFGLIDEPTEPFEHLAAASRDAREMSHRPHRFADGGQVPGHCFCGRDTTHRVHA